MPEWTFNIYESLSYKEAENRITELWNLHRNDEKFSNTMTIINSNSLRVCIKYPGKKKRGDYRLELNGVPISHSSICKNLVGFINDGIFSYDEIKHILEETYSYGYVVVNRNRERQLRALLFWITLQENTNYPDHEGILMPYKRYAEAIDTTLPGSLVNLNDVLHDADPDYAKKGIKRILQNPPNYYR